jgi:polyisoprenoid-binding protein YceI
MKRSIPPALLGMLALLAVHSPAMAQTQTFKIDPGHSEVGFSVRHFFSRVPGRFNTFEGTVLLDEKNLAASSVDVTIQTASIFTNQERRDGHLRSPDFFYADSFPTLTFKSTKVTPGTEGALKIEGNLTMRGVTKPVVLDGHFLGAGSLSMGGQSAGYRASFDATTKVNRKDYGISWNKVLDQGGTMLGDDVAITIGVEAVRVESENHAAVPGSDSKPTKK